MIDSSPVLLVSRWPTPKTNMYHESLGLFDSAGMVEKSRISNLRLVVKKTTPAECGTGHVDGFPANADALWRLSFFSSSIQTGNIS
jgi:hypothetical protein